MVNIMLCCAAGMSTSLLVEKMKKEAEKEAIEDNPFAALLGNMKFDEK